MLLTYHFTLSSVCVAFHCLASLAVLGHLPGISKNLLLTPLHLCFKLSVHTLICFISDWLHVLIWLNFFFVACKVTHVYFGNWIIKTLNGIRLPSPPVSSLYILHTLLWLVLDFSLVNITDFISLKLRYLIFTNQSFCHYSLTLLYRVPHPAGLLALSCHPLMTCGLATVSVWSYTTTTCLVTGRALSLQVLCTIIFAVLYHLFLIPIDFLLPNIIMLLLGTSV